jgi:AcrR family transcriptional regulator
LFDRTAAIQQAMELFWDRGYEGTTFDDLIGAMKLSPSSFYHEFGSKERLYREAVDYYLNVSTSHLRGFSSHRDTRAAFEALIEEGAAFFTNDASPAGCMISLAGAHLPPHLRSVADYTKSLRKLFEQALARRLRKGVSDGNLPPGTNVKELAAYFGTIFRGMAVQARVGASRKQLLAICRVGHCLRFKYSATVGLAKLPCALTMALQSEELNIFQSPTGILQIEIRLGRG